MKEAPLAIVLAGGLGTRLRHLLPGLPKPLAPVAGRPFLEWVLRYLRKQGIIRTILSTGHFADKVRAFADGLNLPGMNIECAVEPEPLGTAGGFLHALRSAGGADGNVLACNGDSLVLASLDGLRTGLENGDVAGALLAVHVDDASRYGTVDVDPMGSLRGFSEKRPGAALINGGVYLFKAATVGRFPRKTPLSFEYDVFPELLREGARIRAVPCAAAFLDIGTEDSLALAGRFIGDNTHWFD